MRSVKAVFLRNQNKYSNLGDYICLMRTVRGRKYTRRTISEAFDELVDVEDYYIEDRKNLVDQLVTFTNVVEDDTFCIKNEPQDV